MHLTKVLRNAGYCGSKIHQVAWRFEFCLILSIPETRAAKSREKSICAIRLKQQL
jgi:hypothetical protein